jgi:lipopolysaccharide/colanic/teichoic acid biosynthesis glycosyltransferase
VPHVEQLLQLRRIGRRGNAPGQNVVVAEALANLALLALSAPVSLVAAIAIKLETPGPIFFRQWRTGFGGEKFPLLKPRTMRKDAEGLKAPLRPLSHHGPNSADLEIRNHPQVTFVGRVLRRLSLDELTNLFNVLARQMSLVGPLDARHIRNQSLLLDLKILLLTPIRVLRGRGAH